MLDEQKTRPVAFVAAVHVRANIAAQFAELYDLKQSHPEVNNEAIYDEHSDIRTEDRRLLADESSASPFGLVRDRLAMLLRQPAAVR